MAGNGVDAVSGSGDRELFASIRLSPIAAVVTDPRLPDNPLVAVNEGFSRLTGYREEDIVGRNCRFLAGPRTEPEAQAALRQAVAEGRPALVELTNYKKDGTPFLNTVMIAPVRGDDGEISYFLGSQMDAGPERLGSRARSREAALAIQALTQRQREVLRLMVEGCLNKQIAYRLGIDEKTVKMHRAALLSRLNARSSAEAVRIGVEGQLPLSDPD